MTEIKERIILASASPRRREILERTGIPFFSEVSRCDEKTDITEPALLVEELSSLKARDVAQRNNDAIVIGADTVVSHNGEILGKPCDKEEAFDMIKSYAGDTHQVYTGVSVIVPAKEGSYRTESLSRVAATFKDRVFNIKLSRLNSFSIIVTFSVRTDVYVNPMTDDEIESYVESGEPMDKAGAYGIQGRFAPFIGRIEGDYYNVVGLPVSILYNILKNCFFLIQE